MVLQLWQEARLPLLAALMAGFGSVISEVGASMMVGGNIRHQTRVLTTAIVLEANKGEFERAIALGLLLLAITFLINYASDLDPTKGKTVNKLIEIHDLKIQRGNCIALEIDHLQINAGQVTALVGPNGAGKTTLLLALAKLLKPAQGFILFNGHSLGKLPTLHYRRRIGFVMQDSLMLDRSVYDNVALGLHFRGISHHDTKLRVETWLEKLKIAALRDRRATQLSGGEAQRVSLARALVLQPELLLLDEPFKSLDEAVHAVLLDDLKSLLPQANTTILFATHSSRDVRELADNKITLEKTSRWKKGYDFPKICA